MINDDISINFSKNWKHLLSTVVRRKKWGGKDGSSLEKGGAGVVNCAGLWLSDCDGSQ